MAMDRPSPSGNRADEISSVGKDRLILTIRNRPIPDYGSGRTESLWWDD